MFRLFWLQKPKIKVINFKLGSEQPEVKTKEQIIAEANKSIDEDDDETQAPTQAQSKPKENPQAYEAEMSRLMGTPAPITTNTQDSSDQNANIVEKLIGVSYPFPESFSNELYSTMVNGRGDLDHGLNDLYNYINKNFPLDDVQKILCAKSKDKIMNNLDNLCGMEVLMYLKQEFLILMNMFKQDGFNYENANSLLKDFTEKLSDVVKFYDLGR